MLRFTKIRPYVWHFFFSAIFIGFSLVSINSHATDEVVPGQILVKYRSSGRTSKVVTQMQSQSKLHLKASYPSLKMHHMQVDPSQDIKQVIIDLENDPDVDYVEPNYVLKKIMGPNSETLNQSGAVSPSVNQFARDEAVSVMSQAQGNSVNFDANSLGDGHRYSQNSAAVRVSEAWTNLSNNNDAPIVAVIDTGIDLSHFVFHESRALWFNANEISNNQIDDDGNGYIDDVYGWNFVGGSNNPHDDEGHGTHVAGIIVGTTTDIFANPVARAKVRIMALKFLDGKGSGATSDAIKAIYYAVNNGAQVINNSWGGSSFSRALLDALTYAYQHGVTIVAAAGNSGKNNDAEPMYPANFDVPSLISVAASNDSDYLATFSDYGPNTVHVAAPGVSIVSTIPQNRYAYESGTSMAAPFVAGMAALILHEAPNLTGYQVKQVIQDSVTTIADLHSKVQSQGRVEVNSSIIQAKTLVSSTPFQPSFNPNTSRTLASASPESSSGSSTHSAGCGSISLISGGGSVPLSGRPFSLQDFALLLILAFPAVAWLYYKQKATKCAEYRKFDRFSMNSEIRVKIGERELIGQMNTIALGGLSFKAADALIEKGGILTMNIQSPDGGEVIQVQGKVVWSEQNSAYGVQFSQAEDGALSSIRKWTTALTKV